MAGPGRIPKHPSATTRPNRANANMRVITAEPTEQPELPDFDVWVQVDGVMVSQQFDWPARTREWWQMWADSPLAEDFTSNDWSELLDTAVIHAKFWSGDTKLAAELRLRTSLFGATPVDRARLKIQFAAADEAEERRERRRQGVRKPDGEDPRLKLMG